MKRVLPVLLLMCLTISGCGKDEQITEQDTMIEDTMTQDTMVQEEQVSQVEESGDAHTASLSFESFDGGGPDFEVVIADESIVSYDTKVKYDKPDHDTMTGAGFDVIITFTGKKPGETTVIIEERSPIAENLDHKYRVTVDEELFVQTELLSVKDINEEAGEGLKLMIDGEEYPVEWEDNESVEALKELCPITVEMSMYGGFEQVGSIGTSLPENNEQITTDYGDIMLYGGDQIVIFYGSNSWSYTRLGHVLADKTVMEEALGKGNVAIKLTSE